MAQQQRLNKIIFNKMVNNGEVEPIAAPVPTAPITTSQRVFKYINIVLLVVVLYSIPGFLTFRQHVLSLGFHSFKTASFGWCILGFFGIYIVKYTYFRVMKNPIGSILHKKYCGEERQYKLKSLLKFSIDTIVYSALTFLAYKLFQDEYWLPWMLGGNGSCNELYRQYPNWPSTSASKMEIYYMIQLGIHSFSVFEMVFIKRGTQRKYYEYLLHHFIAMTLIFFSMMSNNTGVGVTILITHDISDIVAAFSRGFIETIFEIKKFNIVLYIVMTFTWIYTRHVIYPFCLITQAWNGQPSPTDSWYMINFQYKVLLYMCIILECMHMFWTYFLIQLGTKDVKWTRLVNEHENKKK